MLYLMEGIIMIKYIVLILFLTGLSVITAVLLSGKDIHTCHGEQGSSCDSCNSCTSCTSCSSKQDDVCSDDENKAE